MLSALVVTMFLAIPYVKGKYFSYTPQFRAERKIRKVNARLARKQAALAKKAAKKGGNV
jgi:hypothetical protein